MATKMGIRQLRDSLTATLRRVQLGETIEVTHHGKPVAVLSPVATDRIERLLASGELAPAESVEWPPPRHRVTGVMSASEAIEDDRAER